MMNWYSRCPMTEIEVMKTLIREEMEGVVELSVPISTTWVSARTGMKAH